MSFNSNSTSGWMFKKGRIIRNWKHRFVVMEGQQLTYYDSNDMKSRKQKGSLTIKSAKPNHLIVNGLIVQSTKNRQLFLRAANEKEFSFWLRSLQLATSITPPQKRKSAMSVSSDEEELNDQLLEQKKASTSYSGWLSRFDSEKQSWEDCFFCLRGRYISYFKTAAMGGAGRGKGYVNCVTVDEDMPFTLNVFVQKKQQVKMTLSATCQQDMEGWFRAIFNVILGQQTMLENMLDTHDPATLKYLTMSSQGFLDSYKTSTTQSDKYSENIDFDSFDQFLNENMFHFKEATVTHKKEIDI